MAEVSAAAASTAEAGGVSAAGCSLFGRTSGVLKSF
jgi:hypothetical protein